eukprot:7969710-Alexandrium_andersonii.AAC.1
MCATASLRVCEFANVRIVVQRIGDVAIRLLRLGDLAMWRARWGHFNIEWKAKGMRSEFEADGKGQREPPPRSPQRSAAS